MRFQVASGIQGFQCCSTWWVLYQFLSKIPSSSSCSRFSVTFLTHKFSGRIELFINILACSPQKQQQLITICNQTLLEPYTLAQQIKVTLVYPPQARPHSWVLRTRLVDASWGPAKDKKEIKSKDGCSCCLSFDRRSKHHMVRHPTRWKRVARSDFLTTDRLSKGWMYKGYLKEQPEDLIQPEEHHHLSWPPLVDLLSDTDSVDLWASVFLQNLHQPVAPETSPDCCCCHVIGCWDVSVNKGKIKNKNRGSKSFFLVCVKESKSYPPSAEAVSFGV